MSRTAVLASGVAAAACLAVACGSAPPAPADRRGTVTTVSLATFELRDDGIDRFEHCPPPGDIGQEWLPAIPAAPVVASASAPSAPSTGSTEGAPPEGEGALPESVASLTGDAVAATHEMFRHCYHRGLIYDPTQDGRVAVVLRVDRLGHVASVETWGACDLTPEAIVCMRDEAAHVKLHPPAAGSATVTIPAVFTRGVDTSKRASQPFAAAAYVAVETMRPRLHACLLAARRAGAGLTASALMTVDVNAEGHGVHIAVDQWVGSHELLACAAEVMRDAPFARPPAGQGKVVVPVLFNPRPGTR